MFEFGYNVSLHIWHPNLHPDEISRELAMSSAGSHTVGDARRSPAGLPLSGKYKESYWYCDLQRTEESGLSVFLQEVAQRLRSHRDFLTRIQATGGSSELWISWYNESNSAERFGWSLLQLLSELHLDLRIDVYAEESGKESSKKKH